MKGWIYILVAIMAIVVASAATLISPNSTDVWIGSDNFTATSTRTGISHCDITGSSAITGDSVTVNATNSSDDLRITINLSVNNMTDSTDWTFSGNCMNASEGSFAITTVSSVTTDKTVPACNITGTSGSTYERDRVWLVTTNNATESKIKFGSNSFNGMSAYDWALPMIGVPQTWTWSGIVPNAIYSTVTAEVTDGLNISECTLSNIRIKNLDTTKQVAAMDGDLVTSKKTSGIDSNFAIFAIVVIAIMFMAKKKK